MFIWIISAMVEYRHFRSCLCSFGANINQHHCISIRLRASERTNAKHSIHVTLDFPIYGIMCVCVYQPIWPIRHRRGSLRIMVKLMRVSVCVCFVRISEQIDFTWLDECCTNRLLSMSKWYPKLQNLSSKNIHAASTGSNNNPPRNHIIMGSSKIKTENICAYNQNHTWISTLHTAKIARF